MEEEPVKKLFRRFVLDACSQDEMSQVIALLQKQECLEWYGDIMDEAAQNQDMEQQPVTMEVIERRFADLEIKIGPANHGRVIKPSWFPYRWIAASLIGLLAVAGTLTYFMQPLTITHQTAYGETKIISLPDGSEVSLNGNSRVTYAKNWEQTGIRELELDGEAYFKVNKTIDHKKFTVKMAGTGKIEVLGTEFNVNHRQETCKVMLRSGSILLKLQRAHLKQNLFMKPGELVEISAKNMVRKKVDPARYDTWTRKALVFENTSLREISYMLKQTYDIDVEVSDPELWQKQISGTAPIHDIEIFLNALSGSFNLKIIREGNRVLITKAE